MEKQPGLAVFHPTETLLLVPDRDYPRLHNRGFLFRLYLRLLHHADKLPRFRTSRQASTSREMERAGNPKHPISILAHSPLFPEYLRG